MATKSHGFKIRPPKPDEAEDLARVHVRTWQQTYRGQVPDDYLDTLDSDVKRREQIWLQLIKDPQGVAAFIAEIDGRPAGFATAGPGRESPAEGELLSIYLLSEHWGKGVGRALHEQAMSHLQRLGFTEAVLWVLDTNERTRRWYERQGWKPDGGVKQEQRDGFVLNELRYRIDL